MRLQKKKSTRFWCLVFLLVVFLLGIAYFFNKSSSFDIDKIRPVRDFSFQTTTTDSQEEIKKFSQIVSQPFSYLTEEEDRYVFVSKDQKYVIIFFNIRKITPKYWLNYIPIPFLDKRRLSKIADRERNRQEIFSNLKNAFTYFRYQTGLVFLHLFRTEYLQAKIKVIDRDGKKHKIPLDLVPFAIQKKAFLLDEYIADLLAKGQKEKAVQSLCHVLTLVKDECRQGFSGENKAVESSFGFIEEGRPIRVDVHTLREDPSFKTPKNTLREVFLVSQAIESWLKSSHPSIAEEFEDEVQDLLSFLEDE